MKQVGICSAIFGRIYGEAMMQAVKEHESKRNWDATEMTISLAI